MFLLTPIFLLYLTASSDALTADQFSSPGFNNRAFQNGGFQIPSNKAGNVIPMFPNVYLPGTKKDLPHDNRLLSPFQTQFQSTFIDDKDYFSGHSYGMAVGPTNWLGLPVERDSRLLRVPYKTHHSQLREQLLGPEMNPFTNVIGEGVEADSIQDITEGKLDFPLDGNGNRFDLKGLVASNYGFVIGELDFPVKNGMRFPLSGEYSDGTDDEMHNIGLVVSPTNTLDVPVDQMLRNAGLFGGRQSMDNPFLPKSRNPEFRRNR